MFELFRKIARGIRKYLPKGIHKFRLLIYKILFPFFRPFMIDLVAYMAETGEGTDACLKKKSLPMRVHFYSPVPDIYELETRDIWNKKSELAGIDLQVEKQINLVDELSKKYGSECQWPLHPGHDPSQFFLHMENPFAYTDAAFLHCLIRNNKPGMIIEIGSGGSSKVISSAMRKNHSEDPEVHREYVVIDPYMSDLISEKKLWGVTRAIKEKMELTDIHLYEQLGSGDILFIDGSHAVRIGGDVNFAILDVLPRLNPGVLVHFHDIPLPYEYPKIYYTGNPKFRVFWTESYLLQAFLSQNNQFEVILALNYLHVNHQKMLLEKFSNYDPGIHYYTGSGFWIRRKAGVDNLG